MIENKIALYFPKSVLTEMFLSLDSEPEFKQAGVVFQCEKSNLGKLATPSGSLIINPNSHYETKTLRENCRSDGKIIYI